MTVTVLHQDSISTITLNRPDKLNAVNAAMAGDLLAAIGEVDAAGSRVMVLRGEGRGFSAGRDLADAEPLTEDAAVILRETFNPLFEAIRSLRIPTISAVRGPALGVGLGLALACDMTIVSDDARLGSPFANIGAVLDSGGHFHLVNRVGAHRALELIYTARLLSGTEAASIGLVNRSVPAAELDDVTTTLSEALANGPTNAFSLSKRLVQRIEDELLTFRDVLDLEAGAQAAAAATTDYAEGIGAFQEKRKPTFNGA